MNLASLIEYYQECAPIEVQDRLGEIEPLHCSGERALFFMRMSADAEDESIIVALPHCVTFMFEVSVYDELSLSAFSMFAMEFVRALKLVTADEESLEARWGQPVKHIVSMLDALLITRMPFDTTGAFALSVGQLKEALNGGDFE